MSRIRTLILSLSIVIINGCAVFKGGNIPTTMLDPVTFTPSVSYTLHARGGMGSVKDLPENQQQKMKEELQSALEESKYFSHITEGNSSSDVTLDVKLTSSGNSAALIPAFITGLSLYTIPSWVTEHYDVTATVTTTYGSKDYILHDTAKMYQWLPMALAFPFNNFSTMTDVRKNMYRNILMQMKADGLIK